MDLVTRWYDKIAIEKFNASQYLNDLKESISDEKIISICEHNAILLQKESNCWKKLSNLTGEFLNLIQNNSFIKSLVLSKSITNNMIREINKIKSIEKSIIKYCITFSCYYSCFCSNRMRIR